MKAGKLSQDTTQKGMESTVDGVQSEREENEYEMGFHLWYTGLLYPLLHNVIQPAEKENVKKLCNPCFTSQGQGHLHLKEI